MNSQERFRMGSPIIFGTCTKFNCRPYLLPVFCCYRSRPTPKWIYFVGIESV